MKRPRLEPLRYQIRDFILDLLRRDKYRPGDRIPTESELTEMLQVSRSSLREGLHMLEEDRVIRTRHGSGRFLLSSPSDLDFDIARLQSVTEMLEGYEIQSLVRVIGVTEQPANPEIAIQLEIDEGTPVLRIERCRSVGDKPIIYSIDTLETRHFTNGWSPDDFKGSLLDYLKDNYDLQLSYSHALIKVIPGSDLISAGVDSDPDVPWILLIQTNYNQLGDPIIFSHDYHRSDSVTFHVRRLRY